MTFLVDRTPAVNQQMRDLGKRARSRRIFLAYADALQLMLKNLHSHPLQWGDPEYNANHPGGVVYHGIAWPLFVRFVVYEAEKTVIIFSITPLPHSPLGDS